jgi:hypothetical protein
LNGVHDSGSYGGSDGRSLRIKEQSAKAVAVLGNIVQPLGARADLVPPLLNWFVLLFAGANVFTNGDEVLGHQAHDFVYTRGVRIED